MSEAFFSPLSPMMTGHRNWLMPCRRESLTRATASSVLRWSRRRVSKQYRFDVLVAREDAIEYTQYVEFFQKVGGQPYLYKGVLRIGL